MKKKFTEAQIVFALRQAETGTRVAEVCRKMGIAEMTFYRWKRKYGGLGVSELRRLRQLEEENKQLKRMVGVSISRCSRMFSQKNSEASPDEGAGGTSRGSLLGERTAGLPGHRDLPLIASVSLPPQGRPGPAATDRRDRGDAGSVRVSAGPCCSSARGLARQS